MPGGVVGARPPRVRADANEAKKWAGRRTKSGRASVWVGALSRLFCSHRPKLTRTDEIGRRIGVALSSEPINTLI